MNLTTEIEKHTQGAEFIRADLHIHSYGDGGSYDVTDVDMTPSHIVDTAIKEELSVISITDHNVIGNVKAAIQAAENKDLLVLPGIELSTSQGHLLLYFPTFEALERTYGRLDISSDKKTCSNTITQCLDLAKGENGFGALAHIELDSGIENLMPKFNDFKKEVLTSENLLALEITQNSSKSWYSPSDTDPDRKNLFNKRKAQHGHGQNDYQLAKIMSSDAHSKDQFGRNAQGRKKLTRLKMNTLSFEGVRLALRDAAARTRIEEFIPETIPHFVGFKLTGGFLDGQVARLSKNLTCIIGGRGAGKSTMLEAIRCASGNDAREKLLDASPWPNGIELLYKDETGREITFERLRESTVTNVTDPDGGIIKIPIESYGQGQTAETIQHSGDDPSILLSFLDAFVDIADLTNEDEELRASLLSNQERLDDVSLEIEAIPALERALKDNDAKVAELKKSNAKKIVEYEEEISKERILRQDISEDVAEKLTATKTCLSDLKLTDILDVGTSTKVKVGKEPMGKIRTAAVAFDEGLEAEQENLNNLRNVTESKIDQQLTAWSEKEAELVKKIDQKRSEFEAKGHKLDLPYIQSITRKSPVLRQKLDTLLKKKKARSQLLKERRKLVKDRRKVRNKIYCVRHAFAKAMNANLKETIEEFEVSLKFEEGHLSTDFEARIKEMMGWRTSKVPKARIVAKALSPFELLDAAEANTPSVLTCLTDDNGTPILNEVDAVAVFSEINKPSNKHTIERCSFEDRPQIKVSGESATGKQLTKSFSRLSLGQQQSILLSILLFSKSKVPLLVDQPEDNLDSEFIYKTLVTTLRKVKESRQIIVVTHNPNIAVLGDAELIIPLRATNERSEITAPGSIDDETTKSLTCRILEGSEDAFRRRRNVYGI